MKSITLNTNTWHYKLAGEPDDGISICAYRLHVMWGMFLAAILAAFCFFMLTLVVSTVAAAIVSLIHGVNVFDVWATIVPIVVGTMAILALIEHRKKITHWVSSKLLPNAPPVPEEVKPDGFIKEAYKSFKGKYCVPVYFDRDN